MYRNYRRGGAPQVVRLSASDFLSRFLLHILPKSFVRIMCYGFLSRGSKAAHHRFLTFLYQRSRRRFESNRC